MLCTVGDLVEDVVVHLSGPMARHTDTPARIERRRGGSAANVAYFAASTGSPVRFIGRVGADPAGEGLATGLAAAGVDVRVQRVGRTGTIVVLVERDAERTMLPDRGAATDLADVDASWLAGVTWLHVPAYSLLTEPVGATAEAMIALIRRAGGAVSIDVSSAGEVERFGRTRFAGLLESLRPDVVLANADEARVLDARGLALTVVKDGGRSVVVRRGDGEEVVPVAPVERVVDTTGAGDAFAAGFVVATMAGAGPRAAAEAGSRLAARTLGVAGAGLPSLAE